ncbi:MAG TPA: 5'-methylthioadenosine/adenosylhomocysteine nucleosidase [Dehalococcoidia bacterium]|nr:5'-methylthioadenosine/adenosylhomocysteine nucleosidase [Dehalococcoidia bacterium]
MGILGAMEREVRGLVEAMTVAESGGDPGFEYWEGSFAGRRCVLARCGMGKVSAAAGVQRLIDRWDVGCVIVCGLAGALARGLSLGDLVVGDRFIQHDMDASPIFPRFQVPGLGVDAFVADSDLADAAEAAARSFLAGLERAIAAEDLARMGIDAPRVHRGLIVSGDQFVKDEASAAILTALPDALCVEMEGAAVAQVCHLNRVPFVVVRVISDKADAAAAADFLTFVERVAPAYAVGVVRELLPRLPGSLGLHTESSA